MSDHSDRNVIEHGRLSGIVLHGEMIGGGMAGHRMGGMGGHHGMPPKRPWEYLDEDQTWALILRMIDKKILGLESYMLLKRQKAETLRFMRDMIAEGCDEACTTAERSG